MERLLYPSLPPQPPRRPSPFTSSREPAFDLNFGLVGVRRACSWPRLGGARRHAREPIAPSLDILSFPVLLYRFFVCTGTGCGYNWIPLCRITEHILSTNPDRESTTRSLGSDFCPEVIWFIYWTGQGESQEKGASWPRPVGGYGSPTDALGLLTTTDVDELRDD